MQADGAGWNARDGSGAGDQILLAEAGAGPEGESGSEVAPRALETSDPCDGCQAILHTLIEHTGTRVCGMIFQNGKPRSLLAAPILSCSQQLAANAMALMLASYCDLRDEAINH